MVVLFDGKPGVWTWPLCSSCTPEGSKSESEPQEETLPHMPHNDSREWLEVSVCTCEVWNAAAEARTNFPKSSSGMQVTAQHLLGARATLALCEARASRFTWARTGHGPWLCFPDSGPHGCWVWGLLLVAGIPVKPRKSNGPKWRGCRGAYLPFCEEPSHPSWCRPARTHTTARV